MDSLNNLQKRLQYAGGKPQQSRMIQDKLRSLKKALLYSYQAGTMIIDNPNYEENSTDRIKKLPKLEFRCLMNPDKLTFDSDKKMVSVPFEDIVLNAEMAGKTSEGLVTNPVKCGEVFTWKETDTRWLVTLRYLEELAYFRADVQKCYPFPLDIDSKEYWFANIGENQETLQWYKKRYDELNKLNFTRMIYIKRDENTLNYFKRFAIVKMPNIQGKLESWEVQAVSPNKNDDIITVYFKEYFENQYEEISQEAQRQIEEYHELNEDLEMYIYGDLKYTTKYVENATWEIRNQTIGLKFDIDAITDYDRTTVTIESLTGRSGEFDLYYNNKLEHHVIVKSIKR